MDDEAERTLAELKNKIEAVLDLFLRNRNTGTTDALKAAIAHSNSPLILSDQKETGRKMLKDMIMSIENQSIVDKLNNRATVLSWQSVGSMGPGGRSVQLIPDNSFMIRAFDSIMSGFSFLWGEYKRVKKENKDLRKGNKRLREDNTKRHKQIKNMEKKQKALKERINKLQSKVDALRDGSEQ